jgi:hypothetical protein
MQSRAHGHYLDAEESGQYKVVSRSSQGNDSQRWLIEPDGEGTYTIQQLVNRRYLDIGEIVFPAPYTVYTSTGGVHARAYV